MRIAIYGYGNLGKGTECAAMEAQDVELVGVFEYAFSADEGSGAFVASFGVDFHISGFKFSVVRL